mmetsp:Transcript_25134/g.67152  ORF Transcript_25134/g.67152 Transcript_25134/m.67152 type:complete len:493 (+) Transcript_25134:57-1535(+)
MKVAAISAIVGVAAGRHSMLDSWPKQRLRAAPGREYPAPRYVTQPQDHFDTSNSHVWQQAYYVNDTFWNSSETAPVFLCVGGEGPPMDGSAVVDSVHCSVATEWLQETGALMFALEHRYYGCHNASACPVESFDSPTALRYLSSRQAVEDVASFVRRMRLAYSLGTSNRWVTWGGSYPGMLAGWSRLKHPELIHAAVASSAPVHAKFDMHEYLDAVRRAYTVSDNGVGGSTRCAQAIREGHKEIEDMLTVQGGSHAAEVVLGLPNGTLQSRDAQMAYLGNGVAMFPAQSNDPACGEPGCNIASVCSVMTNASLGSPLKRLLELRRLQGSPGTEPLAAAGDEPDYWFWQTCTEFGFYQSCDVGSDCMFVRGLVTAESMAEGCRKAWNITVADVKQNIRATNAHYGALAASAPECVLWPNGEVDPWSPLGVLQSPSPGQPTLWVEGASHHAWTHPSAPSDQPSVVEARAWIRQAVSHFLRLGCSQDFQLPAVLV